MNPGMLRHIVRIENPVYTRDGVNVTETFVAVGTRRCKIELLSGRELMFAQQMEARVSARITLRYTPLVKVESRLIQVVDGADVRTFHVLHVDDVELRHVELRLLCEEIVSAATTTTTTTTSTTTTTT